MPANTSTPRPAAAFVATLHQSRLLSAAGHAQALGLLDADESPADCAMALVGAGVLTPFQARRLLAGKSDGLVLGQYVILDQLSGGKRERVYKARHRTMDRLVAVRVFAADVTHNPDHRAVVQAEARAAARLAHPNLLTVLDSNESGGRLYVVHEYVEALPLDVLVGQTRRLPTGRACEVARQAALGLQHAHEQGLPHGHFRLGCLVVGRPGRDGAAGQRLEVKVAHFGTPAESADDGAAEPQAYRAPESRGPLGKASVPADLYALGAVLFHLLTGQPPAGRSQSARATRPTLPAAVEALLSELLAANPTHRPLSAAEVAGRLEPFSEGDDDSSGVEFDLPRFAPADAPSGGFLSGLHADDTSPWYGIEAGATLENVPTVAPATAPRRYGVAVAGGVALGAAATLAVVLLLGR